MNVDFTGYRPGPSRAMLRARYLAALILIAVLALGEYMVTHRLIEAREHHSDLLKQSIRQRVLVPEIALLTQQMADASDAEARAQTRFALQEHLAQLRASRSTVFRMIGRYEDLAHPLKPNRDLYVDLPLRVMGQLSLYMAAVDSLLSVPAHLLMPGNPRLQGVLAAASGEAGTLEQLVAGLEEAADLDLDTIQSVAQILFAMKLASLVLLGLLLFEPMVTRILHEHDMLMRANQELARVSSTDGLTEVANRRAFEVRLDEEWRRASRDRAPLTLLMIDIDHFKAYNDRYGHQAGDKCLKLITRDFRTRLRRPADFLARYGGEEFSIILPDTDLSGAVVVAEDLRRRTAALEISHAGSPVARVVTLSVGVAEAEPAMDGAGPASLVAAADRALYQAKHLGRNQMTTEKLGARRIKLAQESEGTLAL